MTEATIPLVDSTRALSLFGARDQHVRTIRDALGVSITHRDGEIRVTGDEEAVARYAAIAARFGLLMTGGSDFHGDDTGRVYRVGEVGATPEAYARLTARLAAPAGGR